MDVGAITPLVLWWVYTLVRYFVHALVVAVTTTTTFSLPAGTGLLSRIASLENSESKTEAGSATRYMHAKLRPQLVDAEAMNGMDTLQYGSPTTYIRSTLWGENTI